MCSARKWTEYYACCRYTPASSNELNIAWAGNTLASCSLADIAGRCVGAAVAAGWRQVRHWKSRAAARPRRQPVTYVATTDQRKRQQQRRRPRRRATWTIRRSKTAISQPPARPNRTEATGNRHRSRVLKGNPGRKSRHWAMNTGPSFSRV